MNLKKKLKEMDKAITREDLVNSARKLYKSGWWQSEQLDAVLEEMFPELKESEDERIRKHIVTFIMEADRRGEAPEECAKWLAYLEKQKDITPIVVSNEDWDCQRAYSEGYQKGMAESNKQKPEGWSEEDEEMFRIISNRLDKFNEWATGQGYPIDDPTMKQSPIDWLKSLPNRFSLKRTNVTVDSKLTYDENGEPELTQFEGALFSAFSDAWQEYMRGETVNVAHWAKEHSEELLEVAKEDSAKWSEKDKEIIGNLRHILNAYAFEHSGLDVNGDYIEQNYIDADSWLKSLPERFNLQSNQEWSGEDERMRKAVLDEIEHQIEIMPDADDMDSDDQDRYNELISMSVWMQDLPKCMKPHWKPSEEQMRDLELSSLMNGVTCPNLKSLYDDLKKMM